MAKDTPTNETNTYPPVVAVLGHVDHGKTTLLDTLRKTSIAAKEHGGITQKIGASRIETIHEGKKRPITFIDTPGHEAFSQMRGRGAMAADIGILVVSAVDGVMPQTKESIQLLQQAQIPFVVALTKADMPTKNTEKTKQQLLRENVLLEGLGGDVPYIEISAKTGMNMKELLDLILLLADLHNIFEHKSSKNPFQAIVIESKLDPRIGAKATMVVKNGSISVRDEVVADGQETRLRALMDDKGQQLKTITVGDAVEVLGFAKVPKVGSIVQKKGEAAVAQAQEAQPKQQAGQFPQEDDSQLSLILCADTEGSLEAITASLPKEIKIITQKTGEIAEADILMAKSVGAIVLGFNAKIRPDVVHMARLEKILLKNYTIIYELIDELHDVLEGKKLALEEKIFGKAKILASFPFEKTKVLGIVVLEGRIAKGDKVRLMRKDEIIGESHINSVRQGKNVVSKIEKGQEGGIIIAPELDFILEDVLISHD